MKVISQDAPMPQVRAVRVEIELDDGTVKIWKGEDAVQYAKLIDNVLGLHQVRTGIALPIPRPSMEYRVPGAGVNPQKE
jgi:hypothetical protein